MRPYSNTFILFCLLFFGAGLYQAKTAQAVESLTEKPDLIQQEIRNEIIIDARVIPEKADKMSKSTTTAKVLVKTLEDVQEDTSGFVFDKSGNSNTEKTPSGYRVYSSNVLTTYNGKVKTIKSKVYEKSDYDKALAVTISDRIRALLYTPYAYADNAYVSGMGTITSDSAEWSTAINSTTGTEGNPWSEFSIVGTKKESYYHFYVVRRLFFDFDLSSIDLSGKTVSSSSIALYYDYASSNYYAVDTAESLVFNDSFQDSPQDLGEFSAVGSSLYSQPVNWTDLVDGYNAIPIEPSVIAGANFKTVLRSYPYDYLATAPTTEIEYSSGIIIKNDFDVQTQPYLDINLSESTTTQSAYNSSCEPDNIDDLSFISSCSFASSTGITYTNYKAPFIVWIILTIIFLFISNRLIIEFLIRWRNKK